MTRRTFGSLGEIDDSQLQGALDRFSLGRLRSAESLTNGLFGKNISLETTTGTWVLRGMPWPAGVDDQFRRERFFAAAIRSACELPVPWPYLIDDEPGVFGWPYALLPRLVGDAVDTVGSSSGDHDWDAIAGALGRAALRLRAVRFSSFGEWSPATDGVMPYAGSAGDWLAHRVEQKIERCALGARALVGSDLAWVRGLVRDVAVEFSQDPPEPSYVHHDFKAGNVVVTDIAGQLEVSGLFDLGEGLVADPLEDLARCTWDLAAQGRRRYATTFLNSYLDAGGIISLERLRAYVVFDLLVIWEFGTRTAPELFTQPTFRDWADTVLNPVDRAIAMVG